MEKQVIIDGEIRGKIVEEITLYLVEIDGEVYPYADLGNWIIGEVRDSHDIEVLDTETD